MFQLPGLFFRTAATLGVITWLAGCAAIPDPVSRYAAGQDSIELDDVPFFPQERYQCGPAALTTLLVHSGIGVPQALLTEQTFIPDRNGSLVAELVAATRGHERIPYRIDGTLSDLQLELEAGRPVLVLQNLGVSWYPRWHYAVVVGIDPDNDTVVLRSGRERRRQVATETFLRTWQRGEFWALVALEPGDLPAKPDKVRYFASVAAMESIGSLAAARDGWKAALTRWPDSPVASFGKASAELKLDQFQAAETGFRQLLERHPEMHVARNNLAYVLAAQDRISEALVEIRYVIDHAEPGDPFIRQYESTLAELVSASGRQSAPLRN